MEKKFSTQSPWQEKSMYSQAYPSLYEQCLAKQMYGVSSTRNQHQLGKFVGPGTSYDVLVAMQS